MRKKIVHYLSRSYGRLQRRMLVMETTLKVQEKTRGFALRFFLTRFHQNFVEFLIIVLTHPAESFKILKKRDEQLISKISYVEYKLYHKKLRLFSLGGFGSVLFATLFIALAINFIIPNFSALAATFQWIQTDWSGGEDGGTYPTDPGDRTGWTKYTLKDSGVDVSTASGSVTVTSDANRFKTSDTDFSNATTTFTFTSVTDTGASASVTLSIPE